MIGQSDVLGLMVRRGSSVQCVRCWRRRALVDYESSLDIDLDTARVIDGAVDLGRGRGRSRPPNLIGSSGWVFGGRGDGGIVAVLRQGRREAVSHIGCRLVRVSLSGRREERDEGGVGWTRTCDSRWDGFLILRSDGRGCQCGWQKDCAVTVAQRCILEFLSKGSRCPVSPFSASVDRRPGLRAAN